MRRSGFTLIETIFALAIVLTLAVVVLPAAFNLLEKSGSTRAQADINAIASALTDFYNDFRQFPSCNAGDCDPLDNAANNLRFMAAATGNSDPRPEFPTDTGNLWNLNGQQPTPAANRDRGNAFNHLVDNNPNGSGGIGDGGLDYNANRWRGPYISKLGPDPWGKAYIIHIGAMQTGGCPVGSTGGPSCSNPAAGKGWILSAGPNQNLDTGPNATQLGGDDIGFIFVTGQ